MFLRRGFFNSLNKLSFIKAISPKTALGFLGLLLMGLLAGFAPFLRPYDPLAMDLSRMLEAPSFQHPFGLDEKGADLLSQSLYGARLSLFVAIGVVGICLFTGLVIGSLSAWFGGFVDRLLMRLVDMVSAFPRFLLALALLAVLGSGLFNLMLALCLSGWAGFARLIRAEILHLKKEEYVLSALAYGAGAFRVLIRHIYPGLLGLLTVQCAFSLVGVVVAEAGLAFLGLGASPEIPSWGRLLSSGRRFLSEAPHLSLFPGLMLFALVLSFQLSGEGLRDFFDPRQGGKTRPRA